MKDPKKQSVLIVEDEDAVREPMVEFLRFHGVETDGVPDGAAGIEALEKKNYDVCVVDLIMPGISGEEFISRAKLKYKSLKFIVITGRGLPFEGNFKSITEIPGVAAVLQKPFALEKLYGVISALTDD